jgi:hypothetical protein
VELTNLQKWEQQLENEIAGLCKDVKALLAPPHSSVAAASGAVDELTALDSLHAQSQQLGLNESGSIAIYQRAAAAIAEIDAAFVQRLAAAHDLQLPPPEFSESADLRAKFSKVWREAFATNRPRAVYLRQLQLELQLTPAHCIALDTWHSSVRKSAAASEREIASWKKLRAAAVACAYDELLALAAAELAAAEQAADSEYGMPAAVFCCIGTVVTIATAGTGNASAPPRAHSCSSCAWSMRCGCGIKYKKMKLKGFWIKFLKVSARLQTLSSALRTSALSAPEPASSKQLENKRKCTTPPLSAF